MRHPDFKHRLERVLVIVVHKGDHEATKELLREQRDWIMVPFHASDLMGRDRGSLFIRGTIATAIGSVDLFGMSSPIKSDEYFFGRDELVQTLVNRSLIRHENTGLFGLRKTGKTSVLFAVQRRVATGSILTQYFDCQNPGVHAARWWQVLENIGDTCRQTLKLDHKRDAEVLGPYSESNAAARFSAEMKSLLMHGQLEKVILMLDEIEYVTPRLSGALGHHWDRDFYHFGRRFGQLIRKRTGDFVSLSPA